MLFLNIYYLQARLQAWWGTYRAPLHFNKKGVLRRQSYNLFNRSSLLIPFQRETFDIMSLSVHFDITLCIGTEMLCSPDGVNFFAFIDFVLKVEKHDLFDILYKLVISRALREDIVFQAAGAPHLPVVVGPNLYVYHNLTLLLIITKYTIRQISQR